MSARIIVDDSDGGFVVSERRIAEIPLIDGREQERRLGEELLPVLARENRRRAGDRNNQVRLGTIGERGSDVVDHRFFWRADKAGRTHDDLNDVHRAPARWSNSTRKLAGELVDHQRCRGRTIAAPAPAGLPAGPRSVPRRGEARPRASPSGRGVGVRNPARSYLRCVVWDTTRFCSMQGYTSRFEP